ncbi:MAG: protein adenylyltransferase SelO family protein, partial [Alphaproteobacteria bacterium]
AILTRVAKSHVRVGTFQFFAARGDVDALRTLADHVIARHDSDLAGSETPYRDLLDRVVARQAELIANWQGVGFIHGVMNTDNMSIAGETIDYGPCAFMDRFHPGQVYSSIDHTGRYAYANQPRIAHWNLACFAQALVPLLGADEDAGVAVAQSVVDSFPARFAAAQLRGLRAKLGLCEARDDDAELARELWPIMAAGRADFTNTFRALNHAALTGDLAPARAAFETASAFDAWAERWRARLSAEAVSDEHRAGVMRRANPAVIPRNHRVEEALAAAEHGDLAPFVRLLTVLARPFDDQPDAADLATPPRPDEEIEATFCGT